MRASSRASGAPRQKWIPWLNAMCFAAYVELVRFLEDVLVSVP
jgi:hypothetical protein